MDQSSLVAATAANMAAWHDLMLRGLGHVTRYVDGLWLTPDRVPPIYFAAIAVRHQASGDLIAAETVNDSWIAVCDPWADISLDAAGFSIEGDHPWMVRPPGPRIDLAGPRSLAIERVVDADALADYELASALGFGSTPQPAFTWHPPSVLADPRLCLWRGTLDGRTVSTSMSFVEAGVVGVYGVSTVPEARRRGYATALTVAAMTAEPGLPSVLQPSAMAEGLYRELGYQRFTTFRTWVRAMGKPQGGGET
jgi:hypothetical protein